MRAGDRSPAQLFCLLGGAVLLLRGIVGFLVADSSFDTPGEGWHHLIHLASGLVLLAAERARAPAAWAAIAFGDFYLGLSVIGIVDGDDVAGLIAADAVDKTFHAVIGLLSLVAGLWSLRGAAAERAAPQSGSGQAVAPE